MSDFKTVLDEVEQREVVQENPDGTRIVKVTKLTDEAKQAIITAVEQLVLEVIGADTIGGSENIAWYNALRAEQRKALAAALKGGK